ncbi:MAG: hypothetical protein COV41_00035 [Candidatus Brennerbacteria bacterium CG11_big_fil_rev_8_21_14_0_20_43_10]|uniref:Uncharacterized protein n=1 Tax=Candidatus Brennerbacteria bacterium CG11_big_fil_rev_8_21_14_0_20_43_10 TaxID=1974523 RepID=A0A2H0PZM5_9BACT|nr:MAG: hypothetical protein COV41_00035 [Candidatus Brennerbacteria bacterium CG11_big_fil_rev_8_21_14_0_20_43_10]
MRQLVVLVAALTTAIVLGGCGENHRLFKEQNDLVQPRVFDVLFCYFDEVAGGNFVGGTFIAPEPYPSKVAKKYSGAVSSSIDGIVWRWKIVPNGNLEGVKLNNMDVVVATAEMIVENSDFSAYNWVIDARGSVYPIKEKEIDHRLVEVNAYNDTEVVRYVPRKGLFLVSALLVAREYPELKPEKLYSPQELFGLKKGIFHSVGKQVMIPKFEGYAFELEYLHSEEYSPSGGWWWRCLEVDVPVG